MQFKCKNSKLWKSQLNSIWPIDRTLSDATTRERCQWKGTPHSPKFQHYWNPPIRLFSVISRTLVGEGHFTPLQRGAAVVLYHLSRLDERSQYSSLSSPPCLRLFHTIEVFDPRKNKESFFFYKESVIPLIFMATQQHYSRLGRYI